MYGIRRGQLLTIGPFIRDEISRDLPRSEQRPLIEISVGTIHTIVSNEDTD